MTRKKRWKRNALRSLAVVGHLLLLPLWCRLRRKLFGEECRVLTYHSIGDLRNHETNLPATTLHCHLQWLRGYTRVVALGDICSGKWRDDRGGRGVAVCLTFDDGYADNLHAAKRALAEFGVPATCFVAAAYVGTDRRLPHDAEDGSEATRMLTWDEIRELDDTLVDVGSHGMEHVRFAQLDEDKAHRELVDSKLRLEGELGHAVRAFSFPYGRRDDFAPGHVEAARRAGYEVVASAIYGWNRAGDMSRCIRRIGIDSSDTMFTFASKINGALDLLALAETRPARRLVRLLNRLLAPS